MGVTNKSVVQWFYDRQSKLTLSMTGSRNGADGTANCSESITQAIKDAVGTPYDYLLVLSPYLVTLLEMDMNEFLQIRNGLQC